jgi:hypothetical protein
VILRRFDSNEAVHRYNTFGDDATDDDGRLVKNKEEESVYLEVPHIIPHSLVSSNNALMQLVLLLPVALFN